MNEVRTSFIATLLSEKNMRCAKKIRKFLPAQTCHQKLKIGDHKWRKNKACLCSSGSVGLFERFP